MSQRSCRLSVLLIGALLLTAVVNASANTAAAAGSTTAALQGAVDGSWRSAANKARDQYRHPVATLQFFGVQPDMTVIELEPAGGWYTEILAPFLHAHGHLIEAASPTNTLARKFKTDPAVYGNVGPIIPFAPPFKTALGAPDSADMVLTFRNTHDWLNYSPENLAGVFQAAFKVLKQGGVFAVVEHRAKPFANAVQSAKELHRIPEDYLIELGLKTGFRLDGVSEINANPEDPEDINVHRLPPNLAGPESEHAKLTAVGESDRMTLRFVKP
ncbi:MAG: hypothetical protein ABI379_13595 [Rhodanobacter sp.]